jgi:hypothetical protein
MRTILDRGDAADWLSVAEREEELPVGFGGKTDSPLVSSASRTAMRSGGTHCGWSAAL